MPDATAVLPPMLARMPVPGLSCDFGTECDAPAVALVTCTVPENFIGGYVGSGGTRANAVAAIKRILANADPDEPLWRPFCDEHRSLVRRWHDSRPRPGEVYIEHPIEAS